MEFLRICFGCCLGVRKKGHADVRDAAIEVRANRDWMMSPVHYNMNSDTAAWRRRTSACVYKLRHRGAAALRVSKTCGR